MAMAVICLVDSQRALTQCLRFFALVLKRSEKVQNVFGQARQYGVLRACSAQPDPKVTTTIFLEDSDHFLVCGTFRVIAP